MNDADRENLETRVLVLAATVKDAELTRAILARTGIACVACADQGHVCEQLTAGAGAVLIAEEAFHGGDGCLAEWLGRQPPWSDLPVLILARAGADSLAVARAMEVLGNVTVVERPARVAALISAVRSALRARQRQYQLRGQLVQRERLAEQLQMAMAAANAGSWQVNLTTGEFSASDRAIELHGLPPGTHLTHEQAAACVHPDDRASVEAALRLTFETGKPFRHEHRVPQPDGSIRWVVSHAERRDEGGQTCVIGLVQDVTERKLAEQCLRASDGRFRLAADAVNGIIYEYDFQTGHVERSRGLYEVVGYRPNEVPATAEWWWEQTHPDDRAANEKLFAELTGDSVVNEYRIRHKDGHWLRVEDRAVLLRDDGGKLVKMVGCTTDITERKAADDELRRQKDLLRAITDTTTDLVFVKDRDCKLMFANPATLSALGLTESQAIGVNVEALYSDPTQAEAVRANDRRILTAGTAETFDEVHTGPHGTRTYLSTKTPMRDQHGAVVALVGISHDVTMMRQAEQALVERTALLNGVLEGTTDVIFVKDLDGRMLLANAAFAAAAGSTPEQLVGKTDDDWFPPDVAAAVQQQDEAVIAGESPMQFEETVPVAGEARSFLTMKAPLRDSSGLVVGILGIGRDITERKQAEEALARLAAVVESSHDALFGEDLDGIITSWNPGAEQIFGYRADEIVGTSILRLIPEARQDEEHALQRKIAAGERGGTFEGIRRARDGREFHASITVSPLKDAAGKVVGSSRVVRDITEQKKAEETLRESEARLNGILRRSPAGIVQTDATGRMTLVNPRWCEMLGYTETEMLGRNILDITHPSSVAPTAAAFGRLAAGGPDFQIEKAYCRKDGSVLRAQSNVAAIRSPAGAFLGLIAIVIDISDRLRSDEELRRLTADLSEADRRKDVFLATLAHELRNPLAPIRNGLHVIRLAGSNGKVEQARAMMERQVSQLVRLVDDLLDVSRITQGKVELRRERIELRAVIDAAVETSRPAIEQAGHKLSVVVPDEPIVVDGDATRLAQVVSNLLNNSAKYTHRDGRIRLTARREGGTAVVSVKDDGIGIPPAMLNQVFVMFTQVDRTLEKTTGGLGIGLSLVKGLVEMHGGTIEARSDGEGMGSEFVVHLPVASTAPAVSDGSDNDGADVGVPFVLRRILVVDDNADAAESMSRLLEIMGNEVRTACDGEAGVETAGQFRPDVVLMDIGMPKLNGYEAARRIREHAWGVGMVLVALTGWGQDDDRKKSSDAGFDFHLVKPVEIDAVMKLLAGLKPATAELSRPDHT